MKVFITILVGALIIFAVRIYTLDFAIRSFYFGCTTAAEKLEKTDILGGEQLKIFCNAYTGNIKRFSGYY